MIARGPGLGACARISKKFCEFGAKFLNRFLMKMYQGTMLRVRGLGYPERLISSLGAGACGVVGVGMFVVSVVVSVVSVVAPPGGSPRWGARPTRDPPWAPWAPWVPWAPWEQYVGKKVSENFHERTVDENWAPVFVNNPLGRIGAPFFVLWFILKQGQKFIMFIVRAMKMTMGHI